MPISKKVKPKIAKNVANSVKFSPPAPFYAGKANLDKKSQHYRWLFFEYNKRLRHLPAFSMRWPLVFYFIFEKTYFVVLKNSFSRASVQEGKEGVFGVLGKN